MDHEQVDDQTVMWPQTSLTSWRIIRPSELHLLWIFKSPSDGKWWDVNYWLMVGEGRSRQPALMMTVKRRGESTLDEMGSVVCGSRNLQNNAERFLHVKFKSELCNLETWRMLFFFVPELSGWLSCDYNAPVSLIKMVLCLTGWL